MKFKKQGNEMYATCPFHADGKSPNFRVDLKKDAWFCDVCGEGGGVVQFLSKKTGIDEKEAFKQLVSDPHPLGTTPSNGPEAPRRLNIVATYDYKNHRGDVAYQVCRIEPKTFRQRRPDGKGGWIDNMKGVERVLYRLQEIWLAPTVWVVEGEKDADTLFGLGMRATTNVGGAGKWLDGYNEILRDKEVVLCGDNDPPGQEHVKKIAESVDGIAKSVRIVIVPAPSKDISEYLGNFDTKDAKLEALEAIFNKGQLIVKGGAVPIKSMAEMEAEYIEHVRSSKTRLVNLAEWIPSLRCIRSLVGGEMVSVLASTGGGKTFILQNIAYCCHVPTLLFELELPDSLTFERFVGIARERTGQQVFDTYDQQQRLDHRDLSHVFTCSKAPISPDDMESIIIRSELKMGVRPILVLIDYIQLVKGEGQNRYERISGISERLKTVARSTGIVLVIASQVGRDKEKPSIGLHDAKESGSIENSSGVVMGMWREDQNNPNLLKLRVLKNTKGKPSGVIDCEFKSESMRITERNLDTPQKPLPNFQNAAQPDP